MVVSMVRFMAEILPRQAAGGPYNRFVASESPSSTYSSSSTASAAHLAPIPPEWLAEFEAAAMRPLAIRFRYAFIRTYKPVLDDEPFRAFATTAEYRRWCEENLPEWLGYGRVRVSAG
jgi:hypothetical protein